MTTADEAGMVIRRVFDAPRDLVYDTMTDPSHLQHWWGPRECTITVGRAEARPGGIFHYCMHPRGGPAGMEVWGRFDFQAMERPGRIVFVNGFADEQGERIRYPLLPMWPLEVLNTITLEEEGGRTTMTLHAVPVNASDAEFAVFQAGHSSMEQGFGGMYDVYDEYLKSQVQGRQEAVDGADEVADQPADEPEDTSDREIVITRTLQAPRGTVFDAFTDPARIGQWWGPLGFSVTTESMDVRPGGNWRFEMTGFGGMRFPNLVEYGEVARPERLVYRHGTGSSGDKGFDVRVSFEDAGDGATLLTMRTIFDSPAALAEVQAFGAEALGNQTIDKLAEYLRGATQ